LTVIFFVGIVTNVSARVQTRSQTAQNLPSVEKPSKDDNDTFETLKKLKGSSDSKKRTLLGEDLMKVADEDAEDLSEEGSGDLINEKDDDEYYLDDEDYEDDEDYDDDEDIYDDEDEEYSGDDEYDDEDDYDDDDEDYEEEEDYINKESKKGKDASKTTDIKVKKEEIPKSEPVPSTDDDLHFADDEETGKDLNLSEDEYKVKNQIKNGEILYEYYNEFFEDDDEDYEEEDLNAQLEDKNQHIFANKPTRPSIRKETVPSRSIPSYFGNLSTSHLLLMGASALISFILFTIAFVVCCHQKQQKKKFGNMPFVIDSNLLSKSSQKSHHPSNFVTNSSTSIVKNYQRVPTSTREFLSSDSTSTSCSSGLENPNHLPELMDVGSGETKKPLLP